MLKRKKHGFTLMEMIIVVSLMTVVLGIMTSMFMIGNRVFSDSDVKSTLQIEGQTIQEQLTKICMQGSDIEEVTLSGTSTPIKGEAIKNISTLSNLKEIVVNLRDEELNRKPYTFTLLNKKLEMKDDNNNLKVLSDKVTALKFLPNGNSGGNFQVELEYKKGFSEIKKYSLDINFIFRNKNILN